MDVPVSTSAVAGLLQSAGRTADQSSTDPITCSTSGRRDILGTERAAGRFCLCMSLPNAKSESASL